MKSHYSGKTVSILKMKKKDKEQLLRALDGEADYCRKCGSILEPCDKPSGGILIDNGRKLTFREYECKKCAKTKNHRNVVFRVEDVEDE